MLSDDLRRHPRFPFHSKGELRLNLVAFRGELIDISLFGALFETRLHQMNVVRGDNCMLDILHSNDDSLLAVSGVVVHTNKNLIGIKFDELDKEREDTLRQIGMLNLAPPKLLDRKLSALFQPWRG